MTTQQSLILACVAMVLLVVIVTTRLLILRIREPRIKRLHPQKLATSKQVAEQLTMSTSTSDNYRNLFELPVLFYLLCVLVMMTKTESELLSVGAWLYVALRYAHSYIHCTYNKVMHRLPVFMASFNILMLMWAYFLYLQF